MRCEMRDARCEVKLRRRRRRRRHRHRSQSEPRFAARSAEARFRSAPLPRAQQKLPHRLSAPDCSSGRCGFAPPLLFLLSCQSLPNLDKSWRLRLLCGVPRPVPILALREDLYPTVDPLRLRGHVVGVPESDSQKIAAGPSILNRYHLVANLNKALAKVRS